MSSSPIYARLADLGVTLPPLAVPAASYVPFVRTGNLVFVSGHIAKRDGKPWVGQLGKTMETAEGQAAARAIAIDLLGTLHAALGDLGKIRRIVKVVSLVNSADNRFGRVGARAHPFDHPCFEADVDTLVGQAGERLAYLMIPKVRDAADMERAAEAVAACQARHGQQRALPLQVLIETHGALREVQRIAAHPLR
jgi:enamine deaminase RidA (YjgF/YER057c/UK114 family)